MEDQNILFPGFSKNTASINEVINVNRLKSVIDFMGTIQEPVCDIGEPNKFVGMLQRETGIDVESITSTDLNFYHLPSKMYYKTICCFEVLEHLQNPLFLLHEIKMMMKPDSVLYLSMPDKPLWIIGEHHYFEVPWKHFEKWLLIPLGLRIVDKRKISFRKSWTEYLIGFRPLLRLFTKKDGWRELITTLFFNYTIIYKIKLNNPK